jgi:hypothetical protein
MTSKRSKEKSPTKRSKTRRLDPGHNGKSVPLTEQGIPICLLNQLADPGPDQGTSKGSRPRPEKKDWLHEKPEP